MKTILVTGANRGIGFEIVRQLTKLGHTVILTARHAGAGETAVEKLASEGLKVHFMPLDVTDGRQIKDSVEEVRNRFGRLDVLINNAGIMPAGDKSILETDPEITRLIIATNALAPLHLSQAFINCMNREGRIIMMSSSGGSMTEAIGGWSPVYCVSKTMLNAFTRHLAFALSGKGISVNAMCQGWVRTQLGGPNAPRNVEQGADTAVWLSGCADPGSGRIWQDRQEIPW